MPALGESLVEGIAHSRSTVVHAHCGGLGTVAASLTGEAVQRPVRDAAALPVPQLMDFHQGQSLPAFPGTGSGDPGPDLLLMGGHRLPCPARPVRP